MEDDLVWRKSGSATKINMEEGTEISRDWQTCCWLQTFLAELTGQELKLSLLPGAEGAEPRGAGTEGRTETEGAQRSKQGAVAEPTLKKKEYKRRKHHRHVHDDGFIPFASVTPEKVAGTTLALHDGTARCHRLLRHLTALPIPVILPSCEVHELIKDLCTFCYSFIFPRYGFSVNS